MQAFLGPIAVPFICLYIFSSNVVRLCDKVISNASSMHAVLNIYIYIYIYSFTACKYNIGKT